MKGHYAAFFLVEGVYQRIGNEIGQYLRKRAGIAKGFDFGTGMNNDFVSAVLPGLTEEVNGVVDIVPQVESPFFLNGLIDGQLLEKPGPYLRSF